MNLFKEILNAYKTGMKLSEEKYVINKISRFLRNISTYLIFIVFFLQYWNLLLEFKKYTPPLFSDEIRLFLHKYTFVLFLIWLVYNILLHRLFNGIIAVSKEKMLPLWNTIEDFFEFTVSCLLLLFSLNVIIEFWNGVGIISKENGNVYCLIILNFAYRIFKWIYYKNSNNWFYIMKSYTDYFDIDGNRIAVDDKVIYNRKKYSIYYDKVNKNWWLADDSFGIVDKKISLDEAVNNEKGKITVYKYGMGEKDTH